MLSKPQLYYHCSFHYNLLLCGDVELNSGTIYDWDMIGPIFNERNVEIPSSSTGIFKQSIITKDEGYYETLFLVAR